MPLLLCMAFCFSLHIWFCLIVYVPLWSLLYALYYWSDANGSTASLQDPSLLPARRIQYASLPVSTTIQTLRSIGYCQITEALVPRNIGESFLTWSCCVEDHASGKTLSGLSFSVLPVHGQRYGSREESLSQVNVRSSGCRQDRVFEACLSGWSGYRLHWLQYYLSQVD